MGSYFCGCSHSFVIVAVVDKAKVSDALGLAVGGMRLRNAKIEGSALLLRLQSAAGGIGADQGQRSEPPRCAIRSPGGFRGSPGRCR